jgi:MFS family permease
MTSFAESFGHLSSTIHGVVVSSILIGGTTSGLFAGNISDIYGRTTTITIGALIFGIGATLECTAFKLGQFIAGRVIAGLGEGIFLGNLTVYVCEIAPARKRGLLCSVIQIMIQSGITLGYFMSFGTARIRDSSLSWRIPLVFQALVSFSFAAACLILPPSPRWLLAKGRKDEAISALERLGLASSELEEMIEIPSAEGASMIEATLWGSIRSNFRSMAQVFSPHARRQTALACFMMAFQQFSGIDGVVSFLIYLISPSHHTLLTHHLSSTTPLSFSNRPGSNPNQHLSSPQALQPSSCSQSPSQPPSMPTTGAAGSPSSSAASFSQQPCWL